ncbi:MAG TPA: hypothetical protein VII36_11090 [Usitatibacter sp.]
MRFLALVSLAAPLCTSAATLEITVKNARGAALADAVVWATQRVAPHERPRREAMVEQRNQRFVPMVTVVQVGTKVRFPNRDPVRHHVYSFSAPKPFEIKLYAGTSAQPILFDKPGADGVARLTQLPAGEYDLRAWHYMQSAPVASQPARLRADESFSAAFTTSLKAAPPSTGEK